MRYSDNLSPFDLVQFSALSQKARTEYKTRCFAFLSGLSTQYPDFQRWYARLFDGDSLITGREIFLSIVDGEIAGVIILKKCGTEKKICTLRVDPRFQRRGIGTELIKTGMLWLSCNKPMITVSESAARQYERLFAHFGFVKTEEKPGYYIPGVTEYVYNGRLGDET